MPGYETRKLDVRVGAFKARIRALSDHNQFADPNGKAEDAGICSASWSLFGQLWRQQSAGQRRKTHRHKRKTRSL